MDERNAPAISVSVRTERLSPQTIFGGESFSLSDYISFMPGQEDGRRTAISPSSQTICPSIVFFCCTFPYTWSSYRKLSFVYAVLQSAVPVDENDENGRKEQGRVMNEIQNQLVQGSGENGLNGHTPESDPWGAFYVWCEPQAFEDENGNVRSFVQAGFAEKDEIGGHFDVLWDKKDVRNHSFWNIIVSSAGVSPVLLRSYCMSADGKMTGGAASILR